MFFKFVGYAFAVNFGSHEVVVLIAQYADDLGGERFIQNGNCFFNIAFIAGGHCAFFDLFAGAATDLLHISYEIRHINSLGLGIVSLSATRVAGISRSFRTYEAGSEMPLPPPKQRSAANIISVYAILLIFYRNLRILPLNPAYESFSGFLIPNHSRAVLDCGNMMRQTRDGFSALLP